MPPSDPGERRSTLFEVLLRMCKGIVDSSVPALEVVDRVVDECHRYFEPKITAVLVPDDVERPTRLYPYSWRGDIDPQVLERVLAEGMPYRGTVTEEVLSDHKPRISGRHVHVSPEIAKLGASLGVAEWMVVAFPPYGTLLVFAAERGTFDDTDLEDLAAFGAFASCALQTQQRARAAEREALQRRVHDGALQFMYAAQLRLQAGLQANDSRKLMDEAAKAAELVADGIRDLRALVTAEPHGAAPLDELLRGIAARLSNDVRVELKVGGRLPNLPESVASEIYRIAIEAVSNSLRHSGADRVSLRIATEGEELVLEVEDRGRGFDEAEVRGGLGLKSMRVRAERIGARLEILRSQAGGTLVRLVVPHATTGA